MVPQKHTFTSSSVTPCITLTTKGLNTLTSPRHKRGMHLFHHFGKYDPSIQNPLRGANTLKLHPSNFCHYFFNTSAIYGKIHIVSITFSHRPNKADSVVELAKACLCKNHNYFVLSNNQYFIPFKSLFPKSTIRIFVCHKNMMVLETYNNSNIVCAVKLTHKESVAIYYFFVV